MLGHFVGLAPCGVILMSRSALVLGIPPCSMSADFQAHTQSRHLTATRQFEADHALR